MACDRCTVGTWAWHCPCGDSVHWTQSGRLDAVGFERMVEWHELTRHGIPAQPDPWLPKFGLGGLH